MATCQKKIRKRLNALNEFDKLYPSKMKTKAICTHLSVLVSTVFALVFSVQLSAAPVIQWNPQKLSIEQMQGTQSSHVVKLKTFGDIQGVIAYVVPALQKWVTVSPASIGGMQRGETKTFIIAVNVPRNEAVGVYEGVIQLRQNVPGQPQKNLAKPLPINITISPFVGRALPPDPGAAGKQTLLGIDSDGDGVRDDVQRYIYLTYPDEPKVQAALIQFANEYQGILPQAGDRDAAYNHAVKLSRHLDCLGGIKREEGKDVMDTIKISAALRTVILNTRQRSLAYITFSDNLGGQYIAGLPIKDWKSGCAFDVDALGGGR